MGWILESLANLFLELTNDLICWIISITTSLGIDIGYDPEKTGTGVFDTAYFTGGKVVGLFDKTFPDTFSFISAFILLGYGMVIIISVYKLYETIVSERGERPGRIVVGVFLGVGGVSCSYSLFILFEQIANVFYKLFQSSFIEVNKEANLDTSDVFNLVDIFNNDELFENIEDLDWMSDLTLIFILVTLFVALLFQLVKLLAEVFERYVTLGVLFYTSPLAFAMLTSRGTTDIFRKWIQMVSSQFVLMMINLFFLSVFAGAMGKIFGETKDNGYVFKDDKEFICTMLLLIAWLTVGQKIDEHLRSLGLSVSQSGHGLGTAILAGAMTAKGVLGTAIRPLARMTGRAGAKAAGAAAGKAASAFSESKVGTAVSNAAGIGPAQAVAQAERKNGKLTESGAVSVMNTPGANLKGPESKDGMKALGIDPDSKDFNTIKGQDGAMHNKFADADWTQASMGDGMMTIPDHDGNIIGQFGASSDYEVPNGGAAKNIDTPAGMMTYAATPDIISNDASKVLDSVNASPDYGKAAGVSWTQNANGTLTGTDQNGGKWQAAPDYVAQVNPSAGKTVSGKTGDVSYTVQHLSRNEAAGFTKVNRPASSAQLVKKGARARSAAAKNNERSARRFVKNRKN